MNNQSVTLDACLAAERHKELNDYALFAVLFKGK